MRDFPEGIRSVILDSVYPPEVDPEAEAVLNAERAFDLLFSRCAADEACRAAFPDLETVFEDLVHQLDAEPIILKVRHPLEHTFYDVSLNGSDLTAATFALLYDATQIPWLPRTIFEIHQGVYNGRLPKYILWSVFVNEVFSEGVIYSNLCSEELPFSSPASFSIATAAVRPALRAYFEDYARIRTATCDAWGVPPADPIENKAVMSDIPTLILAGEYDPTTPPDWSRMTAEGLNNAYYFEFPGVGHGVLWVRECAQVMSRDFLELPAQAPDSTCLANQKTSVSFVTGTSR
jgi:pimeloyl-ACP methyl ester carboxylesterase